MRIPDDRTLDSLTPADWRAASEEERREFKGRWSKRGCASFVCLSCGFPTVYGQAMCDACRPSTREELVPNDDVIAQSDTAKTYSCPTCARPVFTQYEGTASPSIACEPRFHRVVWSE